MADDQRLLTDDRTDKRKCDDFAALYGLEGAAAARALPDHSGGGGYALHGRIDIHNVYVLGEIKEGQPALPRPVFQSVSSEGRVLDRRKMWTVSRDDAISSACSSGDFGR
ncbi:hypothetical protein AVEN_182842-1 [Araneus ventricosus]|uniref:Uncharacterized protein n=1 Tax=Araneus ventricosus TaxID=182803 RepID=A0A4Y2M157_ARAVE|nr:hypothetical protein AVEN_182842-1 [Araneus ventricosus]